ncbi:MAG: hypothetical protein ACJ8FU_06805 [Xanthobacteraceae bacterium]|jgi:hypothetical protein
MPLTDKDKRLLDEFRAYLNPEISRGGEDGHLIEEALNRGATERLLVDFLVWRRRYGDTKTPVTHFNMRKLLDPYLTAYNNKVSDEFKSLKGGNSWFLDPDRQRTPEQHYFYMRPLYYAAGFDNPAQSFLSKINPYVFLGKKIPGGVHDALVPGLDKVASILDGAYPGLSASVAASIRSQDGGFVPRFIAGSSELSNHAFGLAVDIDPPSNPHVKGRIIPLLNEVVKRQTGRDFDFGSQYASGKVWSGILSDEGRITVTYLYADVGAAAVQEWLKANLATYEQCLQDIAAGTKRNATDDDRQNAELAKLAIDNERDLQLMRLLQAQTNLATLNTWRQSGIQSLPFALVWALKQAFKGNRAFRWGQEYKSSKDAMHFELQAIIKQQDGTIVPGALTPDAPRVRLLNDLFPTMFLATYSPEFDDFMASQQKLTTPSTLPPRTYR